MKKFLLTLILSLTLAGIGYSQVTTLWEKSGAAGTKPTWDAGSTTRGISYGFVDGKHLLFVVNRALMGTKMVVYYDAATGDSLGVLDTLGVSGGLFAANDVEVSADGKIFLGNMTTNDSAAAFKVYRYDSLKAVAVTVLTFGDLTPNRIGDKFTVTGSTADNSVTVWAATSLSSAGPGTLLKFTTTDNGLTFTPEAIPITQTSSSAAVGPLPNGDFYFNAHGIYPTKYTAGVVGGAIPSTVISSSGSALRYLTTILGDEYIFANDLLTASNNGKVIKVPNGLPASASLVAATPTLGSVSAVGTGDVSVQKVSDYVYNVYAFAMNNGFGAYQVDLTPALAGDYYIGAPGTGPAGADPVFASLREAFDIINEATFTANCTFYITSNITETYPPESYGLGLAVNPEPHTITFKPYTGVQPVITLPYPGDLTSGPSGALVIGVPSKGNVAWADKKVTKNIVIDGSNTVDGTTRDLTITNEVTSHRNAIPLAIVGDVSNLVVKNTNILYKSQAVSTSGNLFAGAVMVRSRKEVDKNWVPNNLLFENNFISSNFDGVAQSVQAYGTYDVTAAVPDYAFDITLRNNVIEGKRRAVALYKAGNHNIIGNEIVLNQSIAAGISNEAIYAVEVDTGAVVNITGNKITKVSSMTNLASTGNTAISIESRGTYNVTNNMISGFELTAANPVAFVRGVKNSSADATLNFYNNTIVMNNLADAGTGTVTYQGIYLLNGTNNVKNNIIVNEESEIPSTCLYRSGTDGTLSSNFNNLYAVGAASGFVGYWNDAATKTLAEWQTASGQDANSVSKQVFFVSANDLHLTGTSIGDKDLTGTPLAEVTVDIDGDARSEFFPYMGADEGAIPLPVELTSFSASIVDGNVQLTWKTATELNNKGFDVQKKIGNEFETIGFVPGRGTSSTPASYSFVDNNSGSGKFIYRLKQIDLNGSYSYSGTVEVDMEIALTYDLNQNYPNPFNPSTTIKFQIAEPVSVTLAIYNTLGAEVAVLIDNQLTEKGQHTIQFDASKLASGTYIYRLTAGNYVQSKKMILMK